MKPTLVTCLGAMAVVSVWAAGQSLSPEMRRKQTQTLSNAKQVATATMLYAGDWDDILPIGQSTGQVRNGLMPYLKDAKVWRSENPGSQLLFNINVTGVSMTTFPMPHQTPIVYESKAWPDGRKVIAYADGHVKLERKEKLPEIEKALKTKWPKVRGRVK